jgi:hypothetical protein
MSAPPGCGCGAHRDQVAERVLALVARVASGFEPALPAVGAWDRHLVEREQTWVSSPPEQLTGMSSVVDVEGVGDNHQDPLRLVGVGNVDLAVHL